MINNDSLESVTYHMSERSMERLNDILEQIRQSQNIAYLAHVGYQAGSPIFQLATKDKKYILMMPGFYELYEYNDFVPYITYELDEEMNLVVKFEDEVYPYGTVEEIGYGGTFNKVMAGLLKSEDNLKDEDFIYRAF